ncbi:ABC transporter permease [Jiangella endophytica]|uniref:ABC transporter permease n=1 Tax=Jiangella endophytica TaxID=1623398 RepID=UPI000E355A9F|nr:ABC transporter permease [Jiangella endophytica]
MTLTTNTARRPEGTPPASRSRRRLGDSQVLLRCSGIAGVLVALELLIRIDVIPRAWFPPVSEIWWRFLQGLGTSSFWGDLGNTLLGWSVGLGLATVLAVPAGMLIGSHPIPASAFRAIIEFLRPIPSVALIPLAVLLWGIDLQTKLFLVTFASFWPILFQALYGVQSVDPEQMQVTRVYRLGRWAAFRHVVMPSTAPYIATGLRISSSIALALSITAEIVVGAPGIGRSIMLAQASSATTDMYALILATGLLGWGLNSLFLRIEKAALHWHPSYRQEKR